MPPHVYAAAQGYHPLPYGTAAVCALLAADDAAIAQCPDCSEGLENRIRAMARTNPVYEELLPKVVSKRYTAARIRRILAQNFLRLTRESVHACLEAPLYCRTLAVRKSGQEDLLSSLAKGKFPLVTRKSDAFTLKKEALACLQTDVRANDLYNALAGRHTGEYETLFV